MFWEENIPVDIIHEDFVEDLAKYKIIILPSATAVSPKLAERLKEYVKLGGTILSEQMFGIFNSTFKLSYKVPGYGFDEVFGANQDDLIPRKNVELLSCDEENQGHCIRIEGNKYTETYKNVTADVLYCYEDGSPAILSNKYGEGNAILTGVNLGLGYSGRELVGDDFTSSDSGNAGSGINEFILEHCYQLGVAKNICSAKDVKVSVTETEEECIMILINSASEAREGIITLGRVYNELQVVYGNGNANVKGSEIHFTLQADESTVLRLRRE